MSEYDWEADAKGCYEVAIAAKREELLMQIPGVKRARRVGQCDLLQGDCLEIMPGLGKVNAVVTDPPYGNSNHSGDFNSCLNDLRGLQSKPIANDDADGMRVVVDGMLRAAVALMPKSASACACFCGGGGGATPSVCLAGRADGSRRSVFFSLDHLG